MATIPTTKGDLDESLLVRSSGVIDGPTEFRIWVEYRLADEPAVSMLRKLQFGYRHETTGGVWFVCLECTGDRAGGHTPSCALAAILRQADVRGAEVVHRSEGVMFAKLNPFDAAAPARTVQIGEGGPILDIPPEHVPVDLDDGKISVMPESDLVKTTGIADTESDFACWVEYRRPGSDQLVHRSAHVFTKKALVFSQANGGATVGATDLTGPT